MIGFQVYRVVSFCTKCLTLRMQRLTSGKVAYSPLHVSAFIPEPQFVQSTMHSSLVSHILFSFFFFIWGKTSALIVPCMTPLNTTFCSMVLELSDQICTPICHRVQRKKKTNIYPSDVTTLVLFRASTCVHCTPWMLNAVRVIKVKGSPRQICWMWSPHHNCNCNVPIADVSMPKPVVYSQLCI